MAFVYSLAALVIAPDTGFFWELVTLIDVMLAPIGILLSPAVGALLMSLSTVSVAINAQLLRRAQVAT